MTNDKGTIKIPRSSFERHNKRRKELGVSWDKYIDGQAPQFETLDMEDVKNAVRQVLEHSENE